MKTNNILLLVVGIIATTCSAFAASLPEPLARAAKGDLQCYSPDINRKTCKSLAAYGIGKDGAIENTAVVLISGTPLVTMVTVSPVFIKSGEVCGTMRKEDIDGANFTVGNHILDATQAEPLRQQMQIAMKNFFDHEICTSYIANGGTLLAKAKMDGVPMPVADIPVIWVAADSGYKVSP